mgnify:CR=1 FL=1
MTKIQIVPVIDIKDGRAVEAKAGKRDQYRGLRSNICNSSNPLDVANAYERLGFKEVYVADLDGILNSKPNLDLIRDISIRTGLSIMADIGIWSPDDVITLERVKPIIATETFSSLNMLEFPSDFILSLDTRNGELLCGMHLDLKDFMRIIRDSKKINEIILLDLARVGMLKGPNLRLCEYALRELPGKNIIYGGGIRDGRDLEDLSRVGIKKVLVGSAVHSGSIFSNF